MAERRFWDRSILRLVQDMRHRGVGLNKQPEGHEVRFGDLGIAGGERRNLRKPIEDARSIDVFLQSRAHRFERVA